MPVCILPVISTFAVSSIKYTHSGVLGGTISGDGYAKIKEWCNDPEDLKYIKLMWMTRYGAAWIHMWDDDTSRVSFM